MAEDNVKRFFIANTDWSVTINMLTDEEAGKLIKHIFKYVKSKGNIEIENNLILELAFCPIKLDLDKEISKKTYGKNHWNWKGGVSNENHVIRNSPEYKNWRLSVFTRDNFCCKHCGKVGGNLHAHHIKPFSTHKELRFCIDNGITLCKSCHIKEHKRLRNE